MLEKVLAKNQKDFSTDEVVQETLPEHTGHVLQALKKLRERTPGLSGEFWQAAFMTCLFHDSGKISEDFQKSLFMFGPRELKVRHELLSGAILWGFYNKFFNENPLEMAALYSHHRRLRNDLTDEDTLLTIHLSLEFIRDWIEFAEKEIKSNALPYTKAPKGSIEQFGKITPTAYRNIFQKEFFDTHKEGWRESHRLQYIFTKAVLNISDWSASGHFELASPFKKDEEELKAALKAKLSAEGKEIPESLAFRKFQKASVVNKHVLAIAPTGSGKTEAALLWASQKGEYDKIIYCLPTRVTSRAIYERLVEYFDKDNCAVVHSSALLYRKEVDGDYERSEYLRDRTFFRNVTVCTIDQILTQGFNLGFWEVKSFHCRNAWIVIDEIHLYAPYTLALILQTIKYLRENLNARFYIMSATMPTKLRGMLAEALGGEEHFQLIKDKELLAQSRNSFEVTEKTVQENLEEIKTAIENRSKVLVVMNTVDQAIEIFEELKGFAKDQGIECICFHSRFIQKHRAKKEKKILKAEKKNKPILLIATQVVEVSLDIDFDLLYTENAPIDALVQRAGRVNRKGLKETTRVVVHPHSEVSKNWIYTEEDVLENTFATLKENQGRISEEKFVELVDQVYKDIKVTERDSFQNGWQAYYTQQKHVKFLGDTAPDTEEVMTRELDSVNVVPDALYEEIKVAGLTKWEKPMYELSIHRDRYKQNKVSHQEDTDYKYVQGTYSKELGLVFPDTKKSEHRGTAMTV